MKFISFLAAIFFVPFLFTGCDIGFPAGTAAERFVDHLPAGYSLAKDPTYAGAGWIVVSAPDGYYAIDIDSVYRYDYASDYDYFWSEATPVWYAGNGYYEDFWGNLYEKVSGNSKDLLAVSARVEEKMNEIVGTKISADYGLSQERGVEIAKLVGEWNKIKSTRAMTDADADKFSVPVLGFKLTDAINAAKTGDTETVDSLIEKAADTNDTTPEHVRDLMRKFVAN